MTIVMTGEQQRCAGPGCGRRFAPEEGWSGLCPSCVALGEEHLMGAHAEADGCPHCC